MAERGNLRWWGRIDALVTVAVCLLLVFLVPVLLAKPRERSIRLVCAANFSQIGKTMFVYAADNEGALPKAGGPGTVWGPVSNWAAPSRRLAFDIRTDGIGGRATISSSLYLLTKCYQMPTRLFLCRGDKQTTEFKLSDFSASLPAGFTLADAWDFGPQGESWKHCSFTYGFPYGLYPMNTSRHPNVAVAADRSAWIVGPGADSSVWIRFKPDIPPYGGTPQTARIGNTTAHDKDGQNVLFLDGRVTFQTRSYCGVDEDNIYTVSGIAAAGHPMGNEPALMRLPQSSIDSFLANDPNSFPSLASPKR